MNQPFNVSTDQLPGKRLSDSIHIDLPSSEEFSPLFPPPSLPTVYRRADIDARMVVSMAEPDLASHNGPPSVRQVAKAAKDMAIAHYAARVSRLRR